MWLCEQYNSRGESDIEIEFQGVKRPLSAEVRELRELYTSTTASRKDAAEKGGTPALREESNPNMLVHMLVSSTMKKIRHQQTKQPMYKCRYRQRVNKNAK